LTVAAVFFIAAIIVAAVFPYFIYKFLNPIDISIKNGDCDMLVCYLNCISAKNLKIGQYS